MPEFILPVRNYRRFEELDAFTQGFIEAMFWTESDTSFTMSEWQDSEVQHRLREGQLDGCIPSDCAFDDLHKDSLAAIIADCKAFQAMHAATLAQAYGMTLKRRNGESVPYDEAQAGHDFWLTRNGHGVGFWDRGLGQVGDDLSAACGWRTPFAECHVFFGDHVDHGDSPFVHVDGLRVSEVAA